MNERWTIGRKLIAGFMGVAGITLLVGMASAVHMVRVSLMVRHLGENNVPAMDVANSVERAALSTLCEARSFVHTGDPEDIERARRHLAEAKENVQAAQQLSIQRKRPMLEYDAAAASAAAGQYEQWLDKTVALAATQKQALGNAMAAAEAFQRALDGYLGEQQNSWHALLATEDPFPAEAAGLRTLRIESARAIQCAGHAVVADTWRAIAERNAVRFQATMARCADLDPMLEALQRDTRQERNWELLAECRAAAGTYLEAMRQFGDGWLAMREVDVRRTVLAQDVVIAARHTQRDVVDDTLLSVEQTKAWLRISSALLFAGVGIGLLASLALGLWFARAIQREHVRLQSEILRTSEAERQRIGRDLHDSLGQSLAGIGYWAEAVRADMARQALPEAADAEKLVRLIQKTVEQALGMSRGLLLADLKRLGLAAALKELAMGTQDLFGVTCGYEGPEAVPQIDLDTASQMYRIAQEAAANAAKHGKDAAITIELFQSPKGLLLLVRDAGKGIAPSDGSGKGMGLEIMRYRAAAIGATLRIDSQRGCGTTVSCLLPVELAVRAGQDPTGP